MSFNPYNNIRTLNPVENFVPLSESLDVPSILTPRVSDLREVASYKNSRSPMYNLNPLATPFIRREGNNSMGSHNLTPPVYNYSTPSISDLSNITSTTENKDTPEGHSSLDLSVANKSITSANDVIMNLNKIRMKHVKNVIIGHLNINSLANKFVPLSYMIKGNLDILIVGETKLDPNFTET